jgi:rare lipoprotein A
MKALSVLISLLGILSTPIFAQKAFAQEGLASFYNEELVGKHTTNGETYDPQDKTAAHASLPFNTKVRLTNMDNGKTVVVRINDRMKADQNKIAIISKSAAEETGIVHSGKARVKIEEIQHESDIEKMWAKAEASAPTIVTASTSTTPVTLAAIPLAVTKKEPTITTKEIVIETTKIEGFAMNHVYSLDGKMQEQNGFGLQLGAFSQLRMAKEFAEKMVKKGEAENEKIYIQVSKSDDKPMVYRVLYGFFSDEILARDKQKNMLDLGYAALVKGFK